VIGPAAQRHGGRRTITLTEYGELLVGLPAIGLDQWPD
jgi:hypothetical protein